MLKSDGEAATETELKCERLGWEVKKYHWTSVTGCVSVIDTTTERPLLVHEHHLVWPSCKLKCGAIISR